MNPSRSYAYPPPVPANPRRSSVHEGARPLDIRKEFDRFAGHRQWPDMRDDVALDLERVADRPQRRLIDADRNRGLLDAVYFARDTQGLDIPADQQIAEQDVERRQHSELLD